MREFRARVMQHSPRMGQWGKLAEASRSAVTSEGDSEILSFEALFSEDEENSRCFACALNLSTAAKTAFVILTSTLLLCVLKA